MKKIAYFLISFISFSCKFDETISTQPLKFVGFVADEYDRGNSFPDFKTNDISKIKFPLKFELFNDYLLIQDYGKGIHVFKTKGLSNPIKVALIDVPASTDFSIKNNILIINSAKKVHFLNLKNLVETIAGNAKINVIKTLDNIVLYPNYPPVKNTIFACPDTTLGFVKSWKRDSISKIECFR